VRRKIETRKGKIEIGKMKKGRSEKRRKVKWLRPIPRPTLKK
jgi:hypothetical protein